MKLRHPAEPRPGFTLVEMLVVLAIILVLVSLIASAVLAFTKTGAIVSTQSEISHLNQALELFKQKFGMYPPSKIFLANCKADYNAAFKYYSGLPTPDQYNMLVIQNSLNIYLPRLFPKMTIPDNPPPNQASVNNQTVDWTGGQFQVWVGSNRWQGTFLEGDQALVFFLGGMQTNSGGVNGCIGFAAFAKNPTSVDPTLPRTDPLYEFSSRRLLTVARVYPPAKSPNPYFVYADSYDAGKPYAYFSSNGTRNGYLPFDCLSLGLSAGPYYEALNPQRYLNPNTFQIISAGADGDYGFGGQWNPPQVMEDPSWFAWAQTQNPPPPPPTKDNQSNFNNGSLMGARN
jgi:general secretion pathway protein G